MNEPDRISVVDIRPGDTIIVHYHHFLTPQQRSAIKAKLSHEFETDHDKVVIIEGGMQVSVARPGANENMQRIVDAVEKLAKQFDQVSASGNVLATERVQ